LGKKVAKGLATQEPFLPESELDEDGIIKRGLGYAAEKLPQFLRRGEKAVEKVPTKSKYTTDADRVLDFNKPDGGLSKAADVAKSEPGMIRRAAGAVGDAAKKGALGTIEKTAAIGTGLGIGGGLVYGGYKGWEAVKDKAGELASDEFNKPSAEPGVTPPNQVSPRDSVNKGEKLEYDPEAEARKETERLFGPEAVKEAADTKLDPESITKELEAQGITDPYVKRAILAKIRQETGSKLGSVELPYTKTSNARIREKLPQFSKLSDQELNSIKSNPRAFFNKAYGGKIGNTDPDDGYNYRGRGLTQLTGKANYADVDRALGLKGELIKNPDLLLDPEIDKRATAYYFKKSGADKVAFNSQDEANKWTIHKVGGQAYAPGTRLGSSALADMSKTTGRDTQIATVSVPSTSTSGGAAKPATIDDEEARKETERLFGLKPTLSVKDLATDQAGLAAVLPTVDKKDFASSEASRLAAVAKAKDEFNKQQAAKSAEELSESKTTQVVEPINTNADLIDLLRLAGRKKI
jgi:predicted chitinase